MADHPDHDRFLRLLAEADFAGRYYALCAAHAKQGPDISVTRQKAAIAATERAFEYDRREQVFTWHDDKAPARCRLTLRIMLHVGQAQWNLNFKTPKGVLGETLAMLARKIKQLDAPGYKHTPPYPVPNIANLAELTVVLAEGLSLYDEIADLLRAEVWA